MSFQFNQEIGQRYQLKRNSEKARTDMSSAPTTPCAKGWSRWSKLYTDELDVQTAEAARQFLVAEGSAILPLLEVHPDFIEAPTTVMPLAAGTFADAQSVFASKAVYVTRRVLTALEFCHGRDVVHGDIKPSNIFRDDRENVMLGDFGVAGYTTEYAAPQLIAGAEKTVATDLWAVAVSFYELLCGEPPYGQRPDLTDEELAAAPRRLRLHQPR